MIEQAKQPADPIQIAGPLGIADRLALLVRVRRPEVTARQLRRTLANACGISLQAVRLWFEGGTSNLKAQHLVSIAIAFDTTIDWLLIGEGPPPTREPSAILPKSIEPGGYQYQDKIGRIHQLEDLSRQDLLQVACELVDLIETLDSDATRMAQRIEAWRFGKTWEHKGEENGD